MARITTSTLTITDSSTEGYDYYVEIKYSVEFTPDEVTPKAVFSQLINIWGKNRVLWFGLSKFLRNIEGSVLLADSPKKDVKVGINIKRGELNVVPGPDEVYAIISLIPIWFTSTSRQTGIIKDNFGLDLFEYMQEYYGGII